MDFRKKFFLRGKEIEGQFKKQLGGAVTGATLEEDKYKHWDLRVGYKIDVKGLKKLRRSDARTNQNYHWVEIQGTSGYPGWLYGEADYIAFELDKYWVIVERLALVKYIESNTMDKFSTSPLPGWKYNRAKTKDITTLISTIDLIYLSSFFYSKEELGEPELLPEPASK